MEGVVAARVVGTLAREVGMVVRGVEMEGAQYLFAPRLGEAEVAERDESVDRCNPATIGIVKRQRRNQEGGAEAWPSTAGDQSEIA